MRSILSTSLAVLALGSAAMAQNQNLVFITNEAVGGTVDPSAGVIGNGIDTDNTRKVLVFDIDFDGDEDVFFLNHNNTSQGLINDGSGVFTADTRGTVLYTATNGVGSKGAFASDVDGDGDMDVFVATGPVGGVQQNNLWLANISAPGPSVSAFFDVSGSEPVHTDHSYDAAALSLNGSRAIIVANRTGAGVTGQNRIYDDTNGDGVYLTVAPADGTFNSANGAEIRNCRDLIVGDFDGDGLDDVFVANAGNSNELNQIFRQSGASLVDDAVATFGLNPGNSYGAAAADLNADGLLDLAVSNRLTATTGQSNFLFQNTSSVGDVDFTAVAGTSVDGDSRASYDVTFGDVDGDGDSDVIVANNNDDNAVFMNNQVENGVAAANFFTQAAADMFSQISDGLLQDNGGRTRSAIIAEFGAYGPDANHQGSEVVLANAITGSNEFYRGMGKQFFDLGGATSGNITPTLEGDGFFSPTTGGSLVIANASANRPAFLTMDIVNFNNPFNGGTQLVDLGSGTAFISGLFNLDGTGGLDLVVAAGDIPAAFSGTQLFVQVATEDLTLPGNFGITNGISLVIQ
jgi:hypothetical protein